MAEGDLHATVIVVGGGPVGLLSACLLARFGVDCVVLEQNAGPSQLGKAGGISPRSVEVFEAAGIVDDVLAASIRLDRIDVIERRSGKVLLRFPVDRLLVDTAYPFQLDILQSDLEPILHEGALRGGADVRFGHRVVSCDQDGAGCRLTVETPAGPVAASAGYVLACDGAHSVVRQSLGIAMDGETWPERIVIVELVPEFGDEFPPFDADVAYIVDPHEWLILVRQPQLWRILYPTAPEAPEPGREEIEQRVRLALPKVAAAEILNWSSYRTHQRAASTFHSGRAFLLGDAAHLITPMGGVGLNTGLEDALNLAWRLAWVCNEGAGEELLEGYDAERRPIAAGLVASMVVRNRRNVRMRNPLRRALRNATFAFVQRSERILWEQMYRRTLLGVSYAPPAAGTRLGKVRPAVRPPLRVGDRAYDGYVVTPAGGVGRFYELLGQGFVAVTFADARRAVPLAADPPPGLRHVVVSRFDAQRVSPWREATYLDLGGELAARFGATPDSTYLIRPDHRVAAIDRARASTPEQLYAEAARLPHPPPRRVPFVAERESTRA